MKSKKGCPICGENDKKFLFEDWQGNVFYKCNICDIVFQQTARETAFSDDDWTNVIDPDGKKRNILTEKEYKIRNLYREILNVINRRKPGKILDVGCGLGFFLSAVNPSWQRYGIENSAFAVNFMKENFKNIDFQHISIDDYDTEENSFDVIVLDNVIEHLANPVKAINKINKFLKMGGLFIVSTPNIGSFCAKRFKSNFRLLGKAHRVLFSTKTLKKLLGENGFIVNKITFPYFKTDYFKVANILRLWDTSKISPPFYKNIMTFYTRKYKDVQEMVKRKESKLRKF